MSAASILLWDQYVTCITQHYDVNLLADFFPFFFYPVTIEQLVSILFEGPILHENVSAKASLHPVSNANRLRLSLLNRSARFRNTLIQPLQSPRL